MAARIDAILRHKGKLRIEARDERGRLFDENGTAWFVVTSGDPDGGALSFCVDVAWSRNSIDMEREAWAGAERTVDALGAMVRDEIAAIDAKAASRQLRRARVPDPAE